MKKNFLAIIVGLIISFAIFLCAEFVFILNRNLAMFPRPQITYPFYGVDEELSVFLEEKFKKSDWGPLNKPHYREIEAQGPHPAVLDYSYKYGPEPDRRKLKFTSSIFKPLLRYRSYVKVQNSDFVLYDVMIEFDERSRRVVSPKPTSQAEGVVFFGDSNTFGEGVNSSETYASQFAKLNPQYQVFNFGIGGSAPNVFLEEVEKFPQYRYANLKMPPKNTGIYLIIDDTVERLLCRLSCLREGRKWILRHPYYKLDSEGNPEYQGTFAHNRVVLNAVYSFFASSALLDFFGVDYPMTLQQKDLDFMAKVIKVYLDKLKKYMNLDRLIVFSYPGSKLDPQMYKAAFAKVGIEFWDFSQVDLDRVTNGQSTIPWDHHPNPLGHYLLAELLTYQLNKTSSPKDEIDLQSSHRHFPLSRGQ